jgi:flavin reductase (DIM6/NTAB) family NADH-FMN oxidoreductase RutF
VTALANMQQGDMNSDDAAIDPKSFRRAVGQFATGVTVVTFEGAEDVRAMTANSFTSLSLDPPLVLVCVGKTTNAARHLQPTTVFSVSILRADQEHVSTHFAGAARSTPWPLPFERWSGGTRIKGCMSAVGCNVHAIHDGGDHWIVVGRVSSLYHAEEDGRPLLFFRGRYLS